MTRMAASSQRPVFNSIELCGKVTTHDPGTYIVLCLHCLHYFRSLTDLLRHRLLNHNILDSTPFEESLPRVSKDGSWLVAGGDIEPRISIQSTPQSLSPGMRNPLSEIPTPSPPLPPTHAPQIRLLGPNYPVHNLQYHEYNKVPPKKRSSQSFYCPSPHGQYHSYNHSSPAQIMSNQRSPIPSSSRPLRSQPISQPTTFSPAAREFVPLGITFDQPA